MASKKKPAKKQPVKKPTKKPVKKPAKKPAKKPSKKAVLTEKLRKEWLEKLDILKKERLEFEAKEAEKEKAFKKRIIALLGGISSSEVKKKTANEVIAGLTSKMSQAEKKSFRKSIVRTLTPPKPKRTATMIASEIFRLNDSLESDAEFFNLNAWHSEHFYKKAQRIDWTFHFENASDSYDHPYQADIADFFYGGNVDEPAYADVPETANANVEGEVLFVFPPDNLPDDFNGEDYSDADHDPVLPIRDESDSSYHGSLETGYRRKLRFQGVWNGIGLMLSACAKITEDFLTKWSDDGASVYAWRIHFNLELK